MKALAEVTGKLDIIVARDPKLAMTPVDTEVVTYDVLSDLDTIKAIIKEAKAHLIAQEGTRADGKEGPW